MSNLHKCWECWELLAQYRDSSKKNCENPNCSLWGVSQEGIRLEEWEEVNA